MRERVSVEEAAHEIGCHVEYLRRQMRLNPEWKKLGVVVKPERGHTKNTYFIFRDKLDEFLGKTGGIE